MRFYELRCSVEGVVLKWNIFSCVIVVPMCQISRQVQQQKATTTRLYTISQALLVIIPTLIISSQCRRLLPATCCCAMLFNCIWYTSTICADTHTISLAVYR